MSKVHAEFLKAYYKIPSIVKYQGKNKLYETDMFMFFEQFPEYKNILKVKRLSYAGGRRIVSYANSDLIYRESSLYKDAHKQLKGLLQPYIETLKDCYLNDLEDVNLIRRGFGANFNLPEGEGYGDTWFETLDLS